MTETLTDSPAPPLPHEEVVANGQGYEAFVNEWSARALQIHTAPEEQPSLTADGRGLHFDKLTIYHGSSKPGIRDMHEAEDHTLARGVYATHEPDDGAIGYAIQRAHDWQLRDPDATPTLYELEARNVSLLDLRAPEVIEGFLGGFRGRIEQWLSENPIPQDDPAGLARNFREATSELMITTANQEAHPHERLKLTCRRSDLLTLYMQELGFQGMIGLEAGEGDTGKHESWVIFDTSTVAVTAEASFEDPNPPAPRPDEPARPDGQWWD